MQYKWNKFIDTLIDKEGYKDVFEGLGNTARIAIIGLLIGIVIGTVIAAIRVMPKRKWYARLLNRVCGIYVGFFRGTPIVVQLLVGFFVIVPLLGVRVSEEDACVVIFGLNSGAYVSEIMRGGINSVDPGQMEAGRALGLGYTVTLLKFIVPQAIKNILPTLGNEFISLIKETSVISIVGATDFCVAFKRMGENNYEVMVPYLVMAVCYIIIVYAISLLIKLLEKIMAKNERGKGGAGNARSRKQAIA